MQLSSLYFLHVIVNHQYTRLIMIVVLASVLTFIDKVSVLQSTYMYYFILGITLMMIYVSHITLPVHEAYSDYGFILLLIILLLLTYNNLMIRKRLLSTMTTDNSEI